MSRSMMRNSSACANIADHTDARGVGHGHRERIDQAGGESVGVDDGQHDTIIFWGAQREDELRKSSRLVSA